MRKSDSHWVSVSSVFLPKRKHCGHLTLAVFFLSRNIASKPSMSQSFLSLQLRLTTAVLVMCFYCAFSAIFHVLWFQGAGSLYALLRLCS